MADIEKATIQMQRYWSTYNEQAYYKDYTEETFILDAIYGTGVALNKTEYGGPSGFGRFKARLLKVLEES